MSGTQSEFDAQKIEGLLDRIMPFAGAAEAVAQRLAGKMRMLALLGGLSACWLIYACYAVFGLSLAAMLPIALVLLIAPLVLGRIAMMLNATIGLPKRIADTADRLIGKAGEYRQQYADRARAESRDKPTLRQLWSTGKSLLEINGLSNEAREVFSLAGAALVIANPIFGILLAISVVISVLLMLVATIVGLAFVV